MSKILSEIVKGQARREMNRLDFKDIYRNIQTELEEVEEQLRLISSSSNKLIAEINSYLFQQKGKRIRPALVILCSKLFNYQGKENIFLASLVEIIHTASLIHDDIIDNTTSRRGRDSVHKKWGPNITVLLGDYLYIKSINLSLLSRHKEIINLLTNISLRMIEGELTEYYLSGNFDILEEDYLDILQKKTASLFSGCCQIGGILGNASSEEESYLVDYGQNLGMCFQIVDDLLDISGDEETLGKPILSDLSEGRITLPIIHSLQDNGQRTRQKIIQLVKKKNYGKEIQKEILDLLSSSGSLDYAYNKAAEFSSRSKEIIGKFPESDYRKSLSLLADFVLSRSY